jgi:hypothetical protein
MPLLREAAVNSTVPTPSGSVWSEWRAVITPNRINGWFTGRDGKSAATIGNEIPLELVPSKTTGVYEIAAAKRGKEKICVYVGRAKTKKNSLRERLGRYIKSGFDLREELEWMLARGYSIYFRWIVLGQKAAETHEKVLLNGYDYAFNKQLNGKYRKAADVFATKHTPNRAAVTNEMLADECRLVPEDQRHALLLLIKQLNGTATVVTAEE